MSIINSQQTDLSLNLTNLLLKTKLTD